MVVFWFGSGELVVESGTAPKYPRVQTLVEELVETLLPRKRS